MTYFFLLLLAFSVHAEGGKELALKGNPSETISLAEAFQVARTQNLSLKQKQTSVVIAESDYQHSWSELLPKLSLAASTHTDILARGADEYHKASFKFSTALFDFSSIARIKSSKEALNAAQATYTHDNNQLLFDVAQAYIEVLMAQSLKLIADQEYAQSKKQFEVFQRKVELGLARPLDESRGAYLLNKASSNVALKEREMRKSLAVLGTKLNRTESFLVSDVVIDSPYFMETPENLSVMAQSTSDIQALQKTRNKEHHALLEQSLKFLPKIQAHVDTGMRLPYSFSTSSAKPFSELMFSIEIPLSLASIADIKRQNARVASAEVSLRELHQEKELNIRGVLEQIDAYSIAEKSAALARAAAEKAAGSAERLYNAGEATALELVEAEVNLRTAQSQEVNAKLRLLQSKIRLLFLIDKLSEIK